MACFDINGLKGTNDREGHSAGDLLIHRTAAHIRRVFEGKAYRTGGDEFVVIDASSGEDAFFKGVEAVRGPCRKTGCTFPPELRGAVETATLKSSSTRPTAACTRTKSASIPTAGTTAAPAETTLGWYGNASNAPA